MTLWQYLQSDVARLAGPPKDGQAGQELLRGLENLARHEGRTPDEIILLLLNQALAARWQADDDHRRWETLSPREKQVAAQVCEGMTNRQIAARLVISSETVKTHVRHLLRKFGMRTRRELRARLKGWDLPEWRGGEGC